MLKRSQWWKGRDDNNSANSPPQALPVGPPKGWGARLWSQGWMVWTEGEQRTRSLPAPRWRLRSGWYVIITWSGMPGNKNNNSVGSWCRDKYCTKSDYNSSADCCSHVRAWHQWPEDKAEDTVQEAVIIIAARTHHWTGLHGLDTSLLSSVPLMITSTSHHLPRLGLLVNIFIFIKSAVKTSFFSRKIRRGMRKWQRLTWKAASLLLATLCPPVTSWWVPDYFSKLGSFFPSWDSYGLLEGGLHPLHPLNAQTWVVMWCKNKTWGFPL